MTMCRFTSGRRDGSPLSLSRSKRRCLALFQHKEDIMKGHTWLVNTRYFSVYWRGTYCWLEIFFGRRYEVSLFLGIYYREWYRRAAIKCFKNW